MAKKMAIVPMDLMSKLQMSAQTDGAMPHLSMRDQQLTAALAERQLPPDVQAMKYTHLYNQYNAYKDSQLGRPIEIPLQMPDPPPPRPPPAATDQQVQATPRDIHPNWSDADRQIFAGMPNSSLPNAERLLEYMRRNPDITWDEQSGEVAIRGNEIPGSSITDIMHHLSRNIGRNNNVAGLRDVAQLLADTNIPRTFIQNRNMRQFIRTEAQRLNATPRRRMDAGDFDTDVTESDESPYMSRGKRQKKKTTGGQKGQGRLMWEEL